MKLSEITEATILEAAIEQLSKPDGYDPEKYFSVLVGVGTYAVPGPSPKVGATCAIGGVEQAIWRLTSHNVRPERHSAAHYETAASGRHSSVLYAGVMRRLNAIARKHPAYKAAYGSDSADDCAIESLTFVAPKRVVLNVFKKALAGAQAA